MYYVDSQRNVTRRDSSLITPKRIPQAQDTYQDRTITDYSDVLSTARGQSTARLTSESGTSLVVRPKGSVQKELVTLLFETMLDSIVESWDVVLQNKPDDNSPNSDKTISEVTFTSRKKKPAAKVSKTIGKKSRSRMDIGDSAQADQTLQYWWAAPDEKAVIRFRNGNIYEGNISMKCMNGEGRFQWADGTTYLGQFKDNEIRGKGMIQWKDDTWYEGDFLGNLRHGKGLYVDSRTQRSYTGGWYCGTKHGQGLLHYSHTSYYDGDWIHNVRHGYGSRVYCPSSGYKGEWDRYVREGKGMMIWPNSDFYRGDWKNGIMSGYGFYIWAAYYNNSMSLPSINAYRGQWTKGLRNGFGLLNFGLGLGSHYKGEFKNNKKHGSGKFITNNGLIFHDKNLFVEDILGPAVPDEPDNIGIAAAVGEGHLPAALEPLQFNICDSTIGLLYHIEQALNNIDRQVEIRSHIINNYMEHNANQVACKIPSMGMYLRKEEPRREPTALIFEDIIEFEESSLRKALRCYESDLKNVYYKYARVCNTEEILFTPVLIRLYLWQFYYDCNVHDKGLFFVEIDRMMYQNPEWLTRKPHYPFEKIYFWQFVHSLISVARRLYAKTQLPGPKPDTILAKAFRQFMERDVLPNFGVCRGRLTYGYGSFLPLKGLYNLYRSMGEPHTVRRFLCAVRRSPHLADQPPPALIDAPDDCLPRGRNVYVFGDEMTFVADEQLPCIPNNEYEEARADLKLFNFGNLSSKTVIQLFTQVFPQLCQKDLVLDLDIEITFFEFLEMFIACSEESIRVKDEELRWREKFSETDEPLLPVPPPSQGTKSK